MTEWQILRQVELPMGIPLIFAGIRTAALFVVSTTTIASLAGYSGTLGDIINNEASYHLSGVIGAAICIAGLALSSRWSWPASSASDAAGPDPGRPAPSSLELDPAVA